MAPLIKSKEWRFSSRLFTPILVATAATVLLVGGLFMYAGRQSDAIALERQTEIISHALDGVLADIPHDQESVTVWDDSVTHTKLAFDRDWVNVNLGVWMHDYFGHDRVYVLNDRDEPVYAMVDGAQADISVYAAARDEVAPLAKRLRAGRIGTDASVASAQIGDRVTLEGRPAVVSVEPIVTDSGDIKQAPGSEFLHVSVRFLDASFVDKLKEEYLLDSPRFSVSGKVLPSEVAYPLRNKAGESVGYFVWRPDEPGARLIARTSPALGGVLLLVGAIIALLLRRIRHASAELQASEAQAQHLAFHDPLTGLANRALFNDCLERALGNARDQNVGLALLYLDLDRFKDVNDTLGHPAGDDLIRVLADRLTGIARSSDSVARLGGDEFAIIQSGISGPDDVASLCERIIKAVGQPFQLLENSAFVGVSIGVAILPETGIDRSELVRKADIALYQAKAEGRNRYKIFSEGMDVSVQRRRDIERELRNALTAGNQFEVFYQPLYASSNLGVVGVEALLRWNHPVHGSIAPSAFIPIAEESGLIHPIGEWVLRQACIDGTRWPVRHVAVNVSPVQVLGPHFIATVKNILQETGLDPKRLELEITESVLLEGGEFAGQTLRTLRDMGVRIALDDFGTGYSSLTYLQKYKVDRIKVDRSFVHNLDTTSPSNAIIQAMVDLARAVGIEVTAEGVETANQREFLRAAGCNELQGFLLSHPLPAGRIDRLFGLRETSAPEATAAAA